MKRAFRPGGDGLGDGPLHDDQRRHQGDRRQEEQPVVHRLGPEAEGQRGADGRRVDLVQEDHDEDGHDHRRRRREVGRTEDLEPGQPRHLDIEEDDQRWQWFRPCLLASINQCTAPCNLRISKEDYRRDIRRLQMFLAGKKQSLLRQLRNEMLEASKALRFEEAARIRDEIHMLETLDERGELDTHAQPEVFYIDPKKGLAGLRKVLKLPDEPRTIEGVDIAHLGGGETVASLVQFIDGLPFKPGYRRYKIRSVGGVDDFRSIHEIVGRRYKRMHDESEVFPDILLIDGGKGQLSAALAAFEEQQIEPPTLISLAKRDEEIFRPNQSEPIRLSRNSFALRLLQYVRDESHRFAQHYHHILRRKSTLGE